MVDNEDLGRYLIEELSYEEIPERLANYFDYEAYGRDFAINEGGEFVGSGYILNNGDRFTEYYDGRDIPEEYRGFAYPDPPKKMPVKEQLEMFGKMMSAHFTADRLATARDERT